MLHVSYSFEIHSTIMIYYVRFNSLIFNSPELKALVSFPVPGIRRRVSVIRLSINFYHFNFLLQNFWVNFNLNLAQNILR